MRCSSLVLALLTLAAPPALAQTDSTCGELRTLHTHGGSTTRYAFAQAGAAADAPVTMVLMVGGGGNVALDDRGCAHALTRAVLMRLRPLLHAAGIATALVDAPSDMTGEDGLAGFRMTPEHADDLGRVIADIRTRMHGAVWVIGHSRGTISAANAAARLAGPAAPDGLVLLSAMMAGDARARKAFVAQTVFDPPLERIAMPVLIVGHVADNCPRSPATLIDKVTARTQSARPQAVRMTGGPVAPGRPPNLAACEVHEPHDFVDQESELAAGLARFVRGGLF